MSATATPPNSVKPSVRHEPAPQTDSHDDLPKDLKKPHVIIVIAVGLLFLAVLAALFVIGYLPHRRAEAAAVAAAEIAGDDTPVVSISLPRPAQGAKEVILPCDIRPYQDTLIFPRASGYLITLNADIGKSVTEGEVLADIDAPEVDAQLKQAEAALQQANADADKAKTDLELADRSYERFKNAAKGGDEVSQQEIDERATARDQANAVLAQMQASVEAAKANIGRLKVMQSFDKITAPFSGTITVRNFDVGALLSPGDSRPIFRLQESDKLRVFVNVPQVYATQIKINQDATLTVRNYLNRTFKGTVTRTASAVNPNTRTMPFELQFPNTDGALVPGMYGQAQLSVQSAPQALLIPVSAMLFNASGTQVAVVNNGKVHFQQVSIGRDLGTDLEVLDGLDDKSQVITNPGERLTEGSVVKVADAPAVAKANP
jgi:membrane fusion protein (multidrug efflux system)